MTTTTTHELQLDGCAPEPLMAYLKALGVFRLVAEQKDASVRACWQGGSVFFLRSCLDREALLTFFLEEYRPTPIIAPWNGGSGFYSKDNRDAITALQESQSPRLGLYRQVVSLTQQMLENLQEGGTSKRADIKAEILEACRNTLPDEALHWLDAAYVLTTDGPRYPPLLGTGGNDGRLEFTNNFMQNLVAALGMASKQGQPRRGGRGATSSPQDWLHDALFGDANAILSRSAVGQFNPGRAGGANAVAGFEGASLVNPWDYVLMLEGALVFAGAAARRLTAESRSRATFPFTVETSAAGYGTAVDAEATSDGSRAELWVPLWEQRATFAEVSHLFGEARAQVGKRQAATGTDFARAVIGLGVERGVDSFQRFGFLKRNGLAFIATPLGRLRTRHDTASVNRANLLLELDPWLESLRRASRGQAPEGIKRAVRQIDRAILEFCAATPDSHQQARQLQEVLVALGQAERWLATSRSKGAVRPLPGRTSPGLSLDWLTGADDGTPEFRLAAALASIQGQGEVGSIRVNLEPVKWERGRWDWAEDDTSVAWSGGDPVAALAAVLERRCLEARMKGASNAPAIRDGGDTDGEAAEGASHNQWTGLPLYGRVNAPLVDVERFLNDRVDYRRIADLLLSLTAIKWFERMPSLLGWPYGDMPVTLSRPYATLKLLLLPRQFRRRLDSTPIAIRPEPSLLSLLRAGRMSEAYQMAARRLRVSGLPPLVTAVNLPERQAITLAAALLIPLWQSDVRRLAEMSLEPLRETNT